MASGARSTSRPGPGPGRGKARARTAPRTGSTALDPTASAPPPVRPGSASVAVRRSSLTARAIALTVVLLILTISYASSLRIYFAQAHEISASKLEISQRSQRITDLQGDLARWANPAYVRTQARERLGWVVPGETAYQVVGADGKPLGGGAEINAETSTVDGPRSAWYADLWGSVEAADKPAPKVERKEPKPITTKTKPTR
jgi:cell division protein FtsB